MTFKRSKCTKCQAFGVTETGKESKDGKSVQVRCKACGRLFFLPKPKT